MMTPNVKVYTGDDLNAFQEDIFNIICFFHQTLKIKECTFQITNVKYIRVTIIFEHLDKRSKTKFLIDK